MIRVALIGLGKTGVAHLAILRSHPDVEFAAVCDNTAFVLDVLSKYTGVKTYPDYKAVFAAETLDAVVVATPSRVRAEIVRAALDRGLHVFCERPFCPDIAEAHELAALAEAKGLVTQVGYPFRFVGAFREARRLLDRSAIGRVHHVRAEAYGPVVLRPKGSTWRTTKSEGGGCLHDCASHAIDLMNFVVGAPVEVTGSLLNKVFSADVDDEVYASFRYPGGATGQLAANWSDDSFRKMSMKLSIWGTAGRIVADRQEIQTHYRGDDGDALGLAKGWNVRYTTELTEPVWYHLRGEEYSAQIDCFLRQIRDGARNPDFSFASGLRTDIVIDQVLRNAAGERQAAAAPAAAASRPSPRGVLDRLLGRNP